LFDCFAWETSLPADGYRNNVHFFLISEKSIFDYLYRQDRRVITLLDKLAGNVLL
jgi:hypothetical protein